MEKEPVGFANPIAGYKTTLKDQITEVREAAIELIKWMPNCSVGSTGHQLTERLSKAIIDLQNIVGN